MYREIAHVFCHKIKCVSKDIVYNFTAYYNKQ
jgi:hypothetical protein